MAKLRREIKGMKQARDTKREQRLSGTVPSIAIDPESTMNDPATALSSELLPLPLPPITIVQLPVGTVSVASTRARTSVSCPGLNVFEMPVTSSTPHPLAAQ